MWKGGFQSKGSVSQQRKERKALGLLGHPPTKKDARLQKGLRRGRLPPSPLRPLLALLHAQVAEPMPNHRGHSNPSPPPPTHAPLLCPSQGRHASVCCLVGPFPHPPFSPHPRSKRGEGGGPPSGVSHALSLTLEKREQAAHPHARHSWFPARPPKAHTLAHPSQPLCTPFPSLDHAHSPHKPNPPMTTELPTPPT